MNGEQTERRTWMKQALLLAGFGSLAHPAAAGATDSSRGWRRPSLVVDVACLGDTAAVLGTVSSEAIPNQGGFNVYVEGMLYRAGTLNGLDGFDPYAPSSPAPIGRWLCRAWFVPYDGRPIPASVTDSTQTYFFGLITDDTPVPEHSLVSSGLEGARAVIGGTGHFRHATGEVVQRQIASNATVLNVLGAPSPNIRFEFFL